MKKENPREIAVSVLRRRATGGEYVEKLLEQELAGNTMSAPDRGLCQELVYGMVRWQATLDWLVSRKTANRQQNAALRVLLHLGLYQLLWLERIPNHAAVHETVELAKRLGFGPQAGFINAVLRGYARERDATAALLRDLKKADPATGYSHPAWLVDRWLARWGKEKTAKLLEWNNSPAPTFARLNLLKTDFAGLTAAWATEETTFTEKQWDWTGEHCVFELNSHPPLPQCESFQRGFFYVQDPSTLLAVKEMEPRPGETLLDTCAAPGGKTAFAAQLMQNRGRIVARDVQPERLKLVAENCARLGVTCADISASEPNDSYDRILVDAPCSNTGVLRRRVDLRWRIRPEEIERLSKTQGTLLRQAAEKLKPGGTLVYSTCSLEPEENSVVIQEFLRAHPDFKAESEHELLPFADNVDGAFVARLKKSQ